MTNKESQKLNNVSKRTTTRDFENLIKKDIIIQIGITGRGTEYTLKWGHKGVTKGSEDSQIEQNEKHVKSVTHR